jgi:hypothetical protein
MRKYLIVDGVAFYATLYYAGQIIVLPRPERERVGRTLHNPTDAELDDALDWLWGRN